MKDRVLKGVVISGETSAQITTDYRLFITPLISYYTASKGYKRWPGVKENMAIHNNLVCRTT